MVTSGLREYAAAGLRVEKIASIDRGWLPTPQYGSASVTTWVEKIASIDRGWLPKFIAPDFRLADEWRK